MDSSIGIDVRGVSHVYRARTGRDVVALQGIDLDVRPNEFHALLGPSGCGKSTLLYLIGGFVPVQTGTIATARGRVSGPSPERGIVFQNLPLFPGKTVRENVLYGLRSSSSNARSASGAPANSSISCIS